MISFGGWNIADVDEIVVLHAEMLAKYGGTAGAANRACVDKSIGAAVHAALYQGAEGEGADLLCIAAHVLIYLARNHCFTDGNKRAAWAALIRILDLNGICLPDDDPEAAPLVERACTGQVTAEDVIRWLAHPERLRARQEPEPTEPQDPIKPP